MQLSGKQVIVIGLGKSGIAATRLCASLGARVTATDSAPAEKLSPDEVLLIARMARDVGCHVYVEYLAQALSYSKPIPVEPVDELKELMRANNELRAKQIAMSERVEKLLARAELKGKK